MVSAPALGTRESEACEPALSGIVLSPGGGILAAHIRHRRRLMKTIARLKRPCSFRRKRWDMRARILVGLLAIAMSTASSDARHRKHHHSHHRSESAGFAEATGPQAGELGGPEGWSSYVNDATGTALEYTANVLSANEDASDRYPSADMHMWPISTQVN